MPAEDTGGQGSVPGSTPTSGPLGRGGGHLEPVFQRAEEASSCLTRTQRLCPVAVRPAAPGLSWLVPFTCLTRPCGPQRSRKSSWVSTGHPQLLAQCEPMWSLDGWGQNMIRPERRSGRHSWPHPAEHSPTEPLSGGLHGGWAIKTSASRLG